MGGLLTVAPCLHRRAGLAGDPSVPSWRRVTWRRELVFGPLHAVFRVCRGRRRRAVGFSPGEPRPDAGSDAVHVDAVCRCFPRLSSWGSSVGLFRAGGEVWRRGVKRRSRLGRPCRVARSPSLQHERARLLWVASGRCSGRDTRAKLAAADMEIRITETGRMLLRIMALFTGGEYISLTQTPTPSWLHRRDRLGAAADTRSTRMKVPFGCVQRGGAGAGSWIGEGSPHPADVRAFPSGIYCIYMCSRKVRELISLR